MLGTFCPEISTIVATSIRNIRKKYMIKYARIGTPDGIAYPTYQTEVTEELR